MAELDPKMLKKAILANDHLKLWLRHIPIHHEMIEELMGQPRN